MSLLSGIKSTVSKIVSAIPIVGKTIAPQVVKSVATPIVKTTSTPVNVVTKAAAVITAPSTVSLAKQTAVATTIIASAAAPSVTSSVISKILPTTSSKLIAAVTVPSAVTLVSQSPKLQSQLSTASTKIATGEYGSDVAAVIEGTKTPLEFLKENPVASTLVGTAVVIGTGIAGKGLVGALTTIQNTQAIKENTQLVTSTLPTQSLSPTVLPTKDTQISAVPITPQTQVLGKAAGTSIRRSYKTRPKVRPTNQSVRVNIYNQTQSLYTRSHHRY